MHAKQVMAHRSLHIVRELDPHREGRATPLRQVVVALRVLAHQQLAREVVFGANHLNEMSDGIVGLVTQLNGDAWVCPKIAYPVCPLTAPGSQIQPVVVHGKPDLDAMRLTRATTNRG